MGKKKSRQKQKIVFRFLVAAVVPNDPIHVPTLEGAVVLPKTRFFQEVVQVVVSNWLTEELFKTSRSRGANLVVPNWVNAGAVEATVLSKPLVSNVTSTSYQHKH